jgi:hypothetical protein
MNPLNLELLVAQRQEEIRREAQRLHLIAQYEVHRSAGRPGAWGGLWIGLGDLLIRIGEGLKSRYLPDVDRAAGDGSNRFYSCP